METGLEGAEGAENTVFEAKRHIVTPTYKPSKPSDSRITLICISDTIHGEIMPNSTVQNIGKQADTPPTSWPVLISAADIATFTAKLPLIHGAVLRRSRRSLTLGVVCPFCGRTHRHRYPAHWTRPAYRLARCNRAAYLILPAPDGPDVSPAASSASRAADDDLAGIVGPPPPPATISGGSFCAKRRAGAASASRAPDVLKIENLKIENTKLVE